MFKCRVDDLSWKIYFYNPSEEELGHCTTPFPVSTCFPTKNNLITQDRESNTTILIVNRHVDSALNGLWRCAHGTKRDDAFVNVTILKEGMMFLKNMSDGRQKWRVPQIIHNTCVWYVNTLRMFFI